MGSVAVDRDKTTEHSVRTIKFACEQVLQSGSRRSDVDGIVHIVIGLHSEVAIDVGDVESTAAVFIGHGDLHGKVGGKFRSVALFELFLEFCKFLFECHVQIPPFKQLGYNWIQIYRYQSTGSQIPADCRC